MVRSSRSVGRPASSCSESGSPLATQRKHWPPGGCRSPRRCVHRILRLPNASTIPAYATLRNVPECPSGPLPPAWGSLSLLKAHNVACTRSTHRARLLKTALDTRGRPARVRRNYVAPLGRMPMAPRHSKQRGSAPGRGTAIPRLTNTGARRKAPDPGDSRQPATAGNPAGAGSSRGHGSQQSRLNNMGVRRNAATAGQSSTDERNSARAVPAPSARTKQGANRMTGLVTRDSAQHRLIASIGRMRVTFLHRRFNRLRPRTDIDSAFKRAHRPSPMRAVRGLQCP